MCSSASQHMMPGFLKLCFMLCAALTHPMSCATHLLINLALIIFCILSKGKFHSFLQIGFTSGYTHRTLSRRSSDRVDGDWSRGDLHSSHLIVWMVTGLEVQFGYERDEQHIWTPANWAQQGPHLYKAWQATRGLQDLLGSLRRVPRRGP